MQDRKKIDIVLKKVGKALGDYQMIDKDDKILVAVSGGEDSITLLDVLKEKQKSLPYKYSLYSVYIDFFSSNEHIDNNLDKYLEENSTEHFIIKKNLISINKKFNCFWCSWNRRKEIFLLAKKLGCRKVALGHNLDDIVVTFLMNLFYHGEISTMPPKLEMFKGKIVLIRPLVYVTKEETHRYVEYKKLPILSSNCPYQTDESFQRRKYLMELVNQLQTYWPNIKKNIFNSLKKIRYEYLV
jgi:tRNA 2-thiocytidine biosynthesis protein TtcA